jgi:hypothetical protein
MLTVPKSIKVPSRLIIFIVFLEKNDPLRVDKWPRRVEIQGSFKINRHILRCILDGSDSAVNQPLLWIGAIRDIASSSLKWLKGIKGQGFLRIEGAEVNIKINSTIMNFQTLKDAELVPRGSCRDIWNIVLN